jgi:hypothetical protein
MGPGSMRKLLDKAIISQPPSTPKKLEIAATCYIKCVYCFFSLDHVMKLEIAVGCSNVFFVFVYVP